MTSVLKMLPSAYGLGQYFQDLGHSFSPYGLPSRQITYISPCKFFIYQTLLNRHQILMNALKDPMDVFPTLHLVSTQTDHTAVHVMLDIQETGKSVAR